MVTAAAARITAEARKLEGHGDERREEQHGRHEERGAQKVAPRARHVQHAVPHAIRLETTFFLTRAEQGRSAVNLLVSPHPRYNEILLLEPLVMSPHFD